jgi:PAS domain S-box-containing protein
MTDPDTPPQPPTAADAHPDGTVVSGGGAMGAAIRAFDWSRTPLGPIARWPHSLRTVVRLMLESRYAMWLAWGPELSFFCNDAYRPTLGVKEHFIGAPASRVWAEIWPEIGPRIAHVLEHGQATWDEGLLLFLQRRGWPEETYHSFSYSPVRGDDGRVQGMLCVVTEDTERVVEERRSAALARMAGATRHGDGVVQACLRTLSALVGSGHDVPFAAAWLLDDGGTRLRLAASAGLGDAATLPGEIDLDAGKAPADCAALLAVARGSAPHDDIADATALAGTQPLAPWGEPAQRARVLALGRSSGAESRPVGVVLLGISNRLPFEAGTQRFLSLAASQVANAVAEARAYEEEAARARALEELDRAKSTFFANVSHELRTPLALILSPLDELLAQADGAGDAPAPDGAPATRELLAVARRNGARLQRLVNTLLDFSRIEGGRMQGAFEATDLATVTADLASLFRSLVERAGLTFVVDCPPLPQPVWVDRLMWEKVMLNLLSNAYKFTLSGRIEVRLRSVGAQAVLTVSDTGSGIPPEAQARLFERFYRVPSEGGSSRSIEGSGIGLALVAELVHLHGGGVGVDSSPGQGSTFSVRLPFGHAHLPPAQLRHTTPAPAGAHSPAVDVWLEEVQAWGGGSADAPGERDDGEASGGIADASRDHQPAEPATGRAVGADAPTIVIADDNADMRLYLQRLLAREHRVLAAADGAEALALAAKGGVDLVLSDVMMPRIDGFELLRRLRAMPATRTLPVILLSARAGDEARMAALEAGADDYLTKPFQARELLARVQGTVALARARSALTDIDDALRASESRHRFLLRLDEATRDLADPHAILATATTLLGEQTAADRCIYALIDPDERAVDVRGCWVRDPGAMPPLAGRFELDHFGLARLDLYRRGEAFQVDDATTDPRLAEQREAYTDIGVIANLSVGLLLRGRLAATIALHQARPRRWTASERELLLAVARRCWDTLERARSQAELRERAARDRFLVDLDAAFRQLADPQAIVEHAVQQLARHLGVGHVAWLAHDPADPAAPPDAESGPERLRTVAAWGARPAAGTQATLRVPVRSERGLELVVELLAGDAGDGGGAAGATGARGGDPVDLDLIQAAALRAQQAAQRVEALRALGQSEARFRELAEAMPQIVFTTRPDGRIEYVNRQWTAYTGSPLASMADLSAVVHPDDVPALEQAWSQSRAAATTLAAEFRLRRRDGEFRWVLTRAVPVRDEAGHVTRWYGTATNIDFQKRQAETLKRAHDALQDAHRRKDEFLATLAHELRNPLAPLRNSLALLHLSGEGGPTDRVRAMMQRQVDHLVRLVDDLLDVSRINAGKIVLQKQPVTLQSVLASAIDNSRPALDAAGHRLLRGWPDDPLFVDGDAVRLVQVFGNLLNNAVRYTPRGGTIRIDASPEGGQAVITVADDGIGIGPEMLPRVFELFTQGDSGRAGAGGLGIGLNLVRNLVELHGGRVDAQSAGAGRGSTFTVQLPLTNHRPATGGAAPAAAPAAAAPPSALLRVLVCDDNQDAADTLGQLLGFLGVEPRVVYDGASAVAVLPEFRPQLVLLDLGMPGMDGYATARALRERPEGQRAFIVALSGWGQRQDREKSAAAGFDRHLVKPIDEQALQSLIHETAGRPALHDNPALRDGTVP